MTLEAGKEMDKCCVLNWLNEVYVTPYRAFDEYTEDELKMFAHDAIALLLEQEAAKPREERHEVKVSHDWGDEVEVWSEFYCPRCGAMIAKSKSEHYPRCMWCGKTVKWDG